MYENDYLCTLEYYYLQSSYFRYLEKQLWKYP